MKNTTTFKDMAERLSKIPLNLNTFLIWTQKPEVSNTVAAFYNKANKILVIDPTYKSIEQDIAALCPAHNKIIYGETFNLDTWDKKVKRAIDVPVHTETITQSDLNKLIKKIHNLRLNMFSDECDSNIEHIHDILLDHERALKDEDPEHLTREDINRLYDVYLNAKDAIESNRILIDKIMYS